MRSLLVALLAALALSVVGSARERGAGPGLSVTVDPKADPVLSRLTLADAQLQAIEKINKEASDKKAELDKADPKPKGRELFDKIKAILDETKKKIREALTAEQQPKFDAGQQVMTDFDAKVTAARGEMNKVVRDTTADADKKAEAKKAYDGKVAAATAERDKTLDEKVGKVVAAVPAAK